MKKPLTPEQAAILGPLHQAKAVADRAWLDALALLGVTLADIKGGDLSAEAPYLLLKDEPVPEDAGSI